MTDETQTDALEGAAARPAATVVVPAATVALPMNQMGYVLTRRDRTAIRFIDWAVKLGTPEFQQRYRPVSDELFTHVYIDPTAKPAFVPPALARVDQLNAESDPLEIIRSHLGVVIDDRQSRDKARLDLQAHLEETQADLADVRARAADLDERLADTTARLGTADARVVELGEQLEAEVSGLHSSHAAELAATLGSHEASVASLTEERDRTLAELAADRDTTVAALVADRDAEVARLEAQLTNDTAEQRAQHEAEIEALHAAHAGAVGTLTSSNVQAAEEAEARHDAAVAALGVRHAAAIAALQAELAAAIAAAEATTVQLREARLEAGSLTAQRDRAIAEGSEWRNRLHQTVGALASTVDVGEWTNDNAPDARLISVVEQSRLALTADVDAARATLDEIEEVATSQLVDETETSDYAIGANDAAVLVLNALYGSAEEGEGDVGAGAGADVGASTAVGTGAGVVAAGGSVGADSGDAQLSEVEEADAEFEAELRDEVDVEFEASEGDVPSGSWALSDDDDDDDAAHEDAAAQEGATEDDDTARPEQLAGRPAEPEPALIGHTAVIEHHIVRDETDEIDDVDKLGSLFADDTDTTDTDDTGTDDTDTEDTDNADTDNAAKTPVAGRGEREHRRAS
ncbi:hypothetical protein [Subtercola boreus]|uniref:Uncharacterized protein n=1 Tax=Subtercola boreus TaxID=120213 RepID=A0A3E0WCI7_9MICO|nr:hypothetical protein [Subtercola boreus]RFA21073.1 hypothetical protein B7R24_06620 [Subtercola boreus]RFA21457.1 hypothetical protein B7R23_06565 [Subtercola boreus]RFA27428.1 hypothetical protein B7R25_06690 [Subtercola boreus]